LQLKSQLEGALLEAQATLEGLQSTDTPPASVLADIASSSAAAAQPPTARPRNAAPGSSNARIHSRSKYAYQKPDFRALAARYPSMLPFLSSKGGVYDFTDPAACRELTRVLLAEDFGIQWWLPLGQLVPPVTNRVNYIHWLEDLLSLSKPEGGQGTACMHCACLPHPAVVVVKSCPGNSTAHDTQLSMCMRVSACDACTF
jgi:hypothetical protein